MSTTPADSPLGNSLTVCENGPLVLHGDLSLAGVPIGATAMLCRCGHSAAKPFCDGSHVRAGFMASGTAAGLEAADSRAAGRVDVRPIHDGPLRIDGTVEVRSSGGDLLGRASQLWLCRCGESARKPFCDGTHKRNGFRADGELPPRKIGAGVDH